MIANRVERQVLFVMFELLPTDDIVNQTQGRVNRSFPDCGVKVPCELFQNRDFCKSLAKFIVTLSSDIVSEMKRSATDSDTTLTPQAIARNRDTIHPAMITELLMRFLQAHDTDVDNNEPLSQFLKDTDGSLVETSTLWKNTREEVLIVSTMENDQIPWSRSPLWLFLRVFLQQHLSLVVDDPAHSNTLYKHFLIFFLAYVLQDRLVLEKSLSLVSQKAEKIFLLEMKLRRRIAKLSLKQEHPWMNFVLDVLARAEEFISSYREQVVQHKSNRREFLTKPFDFEDPKDRKFSLSLFDKFFRELHGASYKPTPKELLRPAIVPTLAPNLLPDLPPADFPDGDKIYKLYNFEKWVADNLERWTDKITAHPQQNSCREIFNIMGKYFSIGKEIYQGSPENFSIMLLTLLELWVASDKVAASLLTNSGLFLEYDPMIPVQV